MYEAGASFINDLPDKGGKSGFLVDLVQLVTFLFNPLVQLVAFWLLLARNHFTKKVWKIGHFSRHLQQLIMWEMCH